MPTPYLSTVVVFVLFSGVILYEYKNHWKFVLGLIISKMLGLFILIWVYSVYYPNKLEADVYKFHSDVVLLKDAINQKQIHLYEVILERNLDYEKIEKASDLQVWERSYNHTFFNENRSYIKLYLLFTYLLGSNFWTLSILMMFLVIYGQLLMFKSLNLELDFKILLLASLPSFLVWNNGLLKESMILFLLGALTYALLRNKDILYLVLPFLVLFKISLGILAIILFPIIFIAKTQFKFLYIVLAYFTIILWHYVLPEWSPFSILQNIQQDFMSFSTEINAGSMMPVPKLENPIFIPFYFLVGIFHTFFAPFPYLFNGVLNKGVIIENFIVVSFLVYAIFALVKTKAILDSQMFYLFVLLLIYLGVIGATTPVAGSLVRYKAPFIFTLTMLIVKILCQNSIWENIWKKRSFTK